MNYQLDADDRELLDRVRAAIAHEDAGGLAKNAIYYSEMVDAMRLLLNIIDGEASAALDKLRDRLGANPGAEGGAS
jgi:hypothetical protein